MQNIIIVWDYFKKNFGKLVEYEYSSSTHILSILALKSPRMKNIFFTSL